MTHTNTSLAALFSHQADKLPGRIAVRQSGIELTYAELDYKARRLAAVLQSHGVGPGQLVGICGDRSLNYVVAMVATMLAGGAYVPIDPAFPEGRIHLMVNDAKPRVILAGKAVAHLFSSCDAKLIHIEQAPPPAAFVEPAISAEDLICVMYTSGSTGTPKGVCIPHRGVMRLVHGAEYAAFGPGVSILQMSALSFDAATFEIWGSLANGGTCVLMPYAKPSLQQIADVLEQEEITTLFLTTALFVELSNRLPRAFKHLKELLTGGESIPASAVRRVLSLNPELNVIACYGPTECTTFTSTLRYRTASEVGGTIPLGDPIAQTELYVLREDLSPASINEEAELYVGGNGLAAGYLNRSQLTAQAFLSHPFKLDTSAKLYRTGDRCMKTEDGQIFFRGRLDSQIKLRGFRIELGEIEAALQRHPAVNAAVVKSELTAAGDRVLVAYVTPRANAVAPDLDRDEAIFRERTEQWRQVYSKLLYRSLANSDQAGCDPTLNTSGWKSSFDGRPISVPEMEEHVGETVNRILSLSPRRVLEIGCGTGMLLFRVAPRVESYVATDFSPDVLDYVSRQLREMPAGTAPRNVTLLQRNAHDIPEPPAGGFDVVILNSVTEHFSSVAYLDELLKQLTRVVSKGGFVFVGDNRSFTLLPHFHASIQLSRSSSELSAQSFRMLTDQALDGEEQLTIDPYFFTQAADSGYARVSIQLRRGSHHNELTGYRYDAVLQTAPVSQSAVGAQPRPWQPGLDSIASLRHQLANEKPDQFVITGIPNARLQAAGVLMDAASGVLQASTVGDVRRIMQDAPAGQDPAHFWELAEELNCEVQILPARDSQTGTFDAVFLRHGSASFDARQLCPNRAAKSLLALGNDPLLAWRKEQIARNLRTFLEAELPDFAVPSFFVVLPRFPLTANGKVDTSALPSPARLRNSGAQSAVAEGSAHEQQIRRLWEEILGIRNISLDEKFFDLGGDSLKAVRLAAEVSSLLSRNISPALLFEQPSLRGFAKLLEQTPEVNTTVTQRGKQRRAAAHGGRFLVAV